MIRFIDARIPIAFEAEPGAGDCILRSEPGWDSVHPVGCFCCAARGPAAIALDRLFLDRVRGAVPWFTRVVVTGEGKPIREALANDAVVSARFRLEG